MFRRPSMSKNDPLMKEPMGLTAKAIFSILMIFLLIFTFSAQPALGADEDDSEHKYHNDPLTYLVFSFLMTFATFAILTSLFTFKFGQKKSKFVAIPMLASGLVIWGIWIFFNFIIEAEYPNDTIFGIVHWVAAPLLKPLMALIGVILGAGLAIFIFLTVVVRS
jgi:hypothetical protein